jgi:hypothetical protein
MRLNLCSRFHCTITFAESRALPHFQYENGNNKVFITEVEQKGEKDVPLVKAKPPTLSQTR